MNTKLIAEERPVVRERSRIVLSVATDADRQVIYRLRHEIYAGELGQHAPNSIGRLTDPLDDANVYLVAAIDGQIAGFVSVTPPGQAGYSIDKYFARHLFPFPFDDRLYEIRLLTVLKPHRGRELATVLMYAAFRWVEAHGGTRIVGIGRREVVEMYIRSGLKPVGLSARAGNVIYDALETTTADLRQRMKDFGGLLERLEAKTDWRLDFPFQKPAACFHGGAFFQAIGPGFESLERSQEIINADVLDAWFPPSPGVISANPFTSGPLPAGSGPIGGGAERRL